MMLSSVEINPHKEKCLVVEREQLNVMYQASWHLFLTLGAETEG